MTVRFPHTVGWGEAGGAHIPADRGAATQPSGACTGCLGERGSQPLPPGTCCGWGRPRAAAKPNASQHHTPGTCSLPDHRHTDGDTRSLAEAAPLAAFSSFTRESPAEVCSLQGSAVPEFPGAVCQFQSVLSL